MFFQWTYCHRNIATVMLRYASLAVLLCLFGLSWGNPFLRDGADHKAARVSRIKRDVAYEGMESFLTYLETGEFPKDVELPCTACKAAAEGIQYLLDDGSTVEELQDIIETLCLEFQIMTEPVCTGVAKNMGPQIVAVLNTTVLSPLQICSFLMNKQCGDVENPNNDWIVELPEVPKPPVQWPAFPSDDIETLRVLHIADTHIDLKYQEGAAAVCNEPLCCREQNGPPGEDTPRAGRWGDWECDLPMRTFDHFLEHAATTHKDIDYIIWTGDLPSHDLWDQTQESTIEIIKLTASKIREAFPDIPVYPAIGNHDSAPVNSFPAPEMGGQWNISWLYDVLLEEWGGDYLNNNENETIRYGAFYSTKVKPGLRLISLNMNYCYLANWWLIVNSTDPAQELSWLAHELQKAEDAGEKVHLLGHIPAGHGDCLQTWSKEYIKILNRYEGTVTAQFFGHTHNDEFEVYYDLQNASRPVGFSFIGPSLTTYTEMNPGYRLYDVDGAREGATGLVVDHETWVFDLDVANAQGEPQWRKSYNLREAFGMSALLPEDFDDLYRRLGTDGELMDKYYKYYKKEASIAESCDDDCARGLLCAIRSCSLYPDLD